MVNSNEIWKNVTGYENYLSVSNYGRILRKKSTDDRPINKISYGHIDTHGYRYVQISFNRNTKVLLIHRLVYQAFIGKLDKSLVIDHIDNDRLNNHYTNLQQITQSINCYKDNSRNSNFENIRYNKENNSYIARITINNTRHNIGSFRTEIEARNAYLDVFNNNTNIDKYKLINNDIKYDKRSKQILQYSLSNELINTFKSISEASKFTNISRRSIKTACDTLGNAKNYKWKYE